MCSEFFFLGAAFEKKGICCEAHFFREEGPKTERADQNEKKVFFIANFYPRHVFLINIPTGLDDDSASALLCALPIAATMVPFSLNFRSDAFDVPNEAGILYELL